MSKKVLILSASPRKGGNSDLLCDQFAKGAEEAGHQVEKLRVQEKKIAPCLACYGCRNTGVCVQKDDMAEILEKMVKADVLVLATPVYFYSMDGQLKTLIDRTLPRYTEIRDKEVYLFGTAGFGGDAAYFDQVLGRVEQNLNNSNRLVGTYMCQGKMPPAVRARYEAMPESPRRTAMLENFDRALAHPDEQDLAKLRAAVEA